MNSNRINDALQRKRLPVFAFIASDLKLSETLSATCIHRMRISLVLSCWTGLFLSAVRGFEDLVTFSLAAVEARSPAQFIAGLRFGSLSLVRNISGAFLNSFLPNLDNKCPPN